MSYFLDNWGSFISLLGVAITIVGFIIAIRRATQARSAATAAQAATKETQNIIAKVLTVADLQRAIALVQRLKVLHRDDNWEASLEHYQPLRAMLADINSRLPLPGSERQTRLQQAITDISVIETGVTMAIRGGSDPSRGSNSYEALNILQAMLERLASSTYFPGSEANR